MAPILIINENKCPPQDFKSLHDLGYTILWTEGDDVPSVQLVPSKEDNRFTAACAAMKALIPGYADCDPKHAAGTAMAAVQFADALLLELDQIK